MFWRRYTLQLKIYMQNQIQLKIAKWFANLLQPTTNVPTNQQPQ